MTDSKDGNRVLEGDDEVIVALGLCAQLDKLGCTAVGPVTTGEQALEAILRDSTIAG